jgi:hypothetical protein
MNTILGRWDAVIHLPDRDYASWFEITDYNGLSGRFVGIEGSARSITELNCMENKFDFRLPPQYEKRDFDLIFKGKIENGIISGITNDDDGKWIKFEAVPAPILEYREVAWGEPIKLIRKNFSNWTKRFSEASSGWKSKNGVLSNSPPSVDIVTKEKYTDFKLHVEWRIPEAGNSGIYLRGRYEVQIVDDQQRKPSDRSTGSIYGFLQPSVKSTRPVGEWNTYDITLIGRWVTIVHNGFTIIKKREIPGITGGALDSDEGKSGPIMLQGDHKAVEYRNMILTPIKNSDTSV